MKISPINNVSFKSFLPPESKVLRGNNTRDFWPDFTIECAMNPGQKEKLDTLLRELANNGDNNILALETTKDVTDAFQHNYYFRLYANNNDLLADRKEKSITKQNRDLTKRVWIQPTDGWYGDGNFVELEGDLEIGEKSNRDYFKHHKYFTAMGIADALLHCLEKIVRDPERKMFDLKNSEPTKYLKQFRAKV